MENKKIDSHILEVQRINTSKPRVVFTAKIDEGYLVDEIIAILIKLYPPKDNFIVHTYQDEEGIARKYCLNELGRNTEDIKN
jgi:hypothetical protein